MNLFLALLSTLSQDRPVSTDDRLVLELVAKEPDVNTPVGMTVDARGRVWVIESNTHFPPKNYKGKPTDRILVMEDFASDGHAQKITLFADGFRYAMGIITGPRGDVYVATRSEIFLLRDAKGSGAAPERSTIVKLETKGKYPHNGLSGFAWDRDGNLYFGFGENEGQDWTMTGSDGSTLTGGEAGKIFRCRPDGSKLHQVATGFWNPFHLCFDVYGRLWAVDNDPDERPPCRLLHIVQGGDYGFRYRNGRKGLHPFTAWNGELPGTLPMTSHTGEAPAGIVAYESDAFPPEYRGTLIGTSWGDHLIERYKLVPKGASFTSRPETIVKGGEHFRPVGAGLAPDGSIFFTDWVDKSYELHGKGRVWRLRAKVPGTRPVPTSAPPDSPALKHMNEILSITSKEQLEGLIPLLADPDPFLVSAAMDALSRVGDASIVAKHAASANPKIRVGVLVILRRLGDTSLVEKFLGDPDQEVRRSAIQWVGEGRLKEHEEAMVRAAQRAPVTREIFEAFLASSEILAGRSLAKADQFGSDILLAQVLDDERQPAIFRALALRMLRKDHPSASLARLENLFASDDAGLRLEATKALVGRPEASAQALLRNAIGDPALRWEAIAGLTHSASSSEETRRLLLAQEPGLEVLRSLSAAIDRPEIKAWFGEIAKKGGDLGEKASLILSPRTQDPDWYKVAEEEGDPTAGGRTFFHPKGPQCFTCHSVNGRGGIVGPDLTTIGRALNRRKIVESILEPSKEIAPAFVYWKIRTKKEDIVDGRILYEDPAPTGHVILINAQGQRTKVENKDIDERVASTVSLMPEKLVAAMTKKEFRDLVSFLSELR